LKIFKIIIFIINDCLRIIKLHSIKFPCTSWFISALNSLRLNSISKTETSLFIVKNKISFQQKISTTIAKTLFMKILFTFWILAHFISEFLSNCYLLSFYFLLKFLRKWIKSKTFLIFKIILYIIIRNYFSKRNYFQ
jgi:hypothetical protein